MTLFIVALFAYPPPSTNEDLAKRVAELEARPIGQRGERGTAGPQGPPGVPDPHVASAINAMARITWLEQRYEEFKEKRAQLIPELKDMVDANKKESHGFR